MNEMLSAVIAGTVTLVMAYLVLDQKFRGAFTTFIRAIGNAYVDAVRALQGRTVPK